MLGFQHSHFCWSVTLKSTPFKILLILNENLRPYQSLCLLQKSLFRSKLFLGKGNVKKNNNLLPFSHLLNGVMVKITHRHFDAFYENISANVNSHAYHFSVYFEEDSIMNSSRLQFF